MLERRVRWAAVRRNSADEGLHTMVTADLDELQTVLDQAISTAQVPLERPAEMTVLGPALRCEQSIQLPDLRRADTFTMKLFDEPIIPSADAREPAAAGDCGGTNRADTGQAETDCLMGQLKHSGKEADHAEADRHRADRG